MLDQDQEPNLFGLQRKKREASQPPARPPRAAPVKPAPLEQAQSTPMEIDENKVLRNTPQQNQPPARTQIFCPACNKVFVCKVTLLQE